MRGHSMFLCKRAGIERRTRDATTPYPRTTLSHRGQFYSWGLLPLLLALILTACSTLRLVSDYDEKIDQGVTEFQEGFLGFIQDMNRKVRTPAGTYDQNIAFYDRWTPKLQVLSDRALAANPSGTCPGSETFGGLLQQGFGGLSIAVQSTTSAFIQAGALPSPQQNMSVQFGTLTAGELSGDCTARLLQLLGRQFSNFAAFHKAQGPIGIDPRGQAPVTLVESTIHAVIYTELAKKPK